MSADRLKSISLVFLTLFVISSSSPLYEENLSAFCSKVPSAAEAESTAQCRAEPYFSPLVKLNECCRGVNKKECLDKAREEDQRIQRAFLEWREEEAAEQQYVKQLDNCRKTFRMLKLNGCSGNPATCVDPASAIDKCAPGSGSSSQCFQNVTSILRTAAMASMCLSDQSNAKSREPQETVHLKCFKQQALSGMYEGLREQATIMSRSCIQGKYGRDAMLSNIEFEEKIRMAYPTYVETLMRSKEGVYDYGSKWAKEIVTSLCEKPMPAMSYRCAQTPVMMNHLNYQRIAAVNSTISGCCGSFRGPAQADNLFKCFQDGGLAPELFPTTGNYFRSVLRDALDVNHECLTPSADKKGRTVYYERQMPREEKDGYFLDVKPLEYHQSFENEFQKSDFKMNALNYNFFIRPLASKPEYKEAACSACQVGERLGKQAYSFPALMCPALVYKNYYNPLKFETDCSDKLFYQVQVAHYCCLYAAFDKYSFAELDTKTCPDVADVDMSYQ